VVTDIFRVELVGRTLWMVVSHGLPLWSHIGEEVSKEWLGRCNSKSCAVDRRLWRIETVPVVTHSWVDNS
jgi:hypothetical protein